MGMMDGGMGGMMGGMMGAMLGVMMQYLYNGRAIPITGVFMSAIYLVSMIALVRLVRQSAAVSREIDPVCKMRVDPRTSLQYIYRDQTYYFCAPACQRSFAKTPEAYLGK
jgi:YHS domain-containing protein